MRLTLFCPGQGSQSSEMFLNKKELIARVQDWLLQAGVKDPLETILQNNQVLFSNSFAQPLIVATSLAVWEYLKPHLPAPTLVAGYSVGEIAAYAVAGSMTSVDAVKLARKRAILMDECLLNTPKQALLAVTGLKNMELIKKFPVEIAIQNAEDAFVLGGLNTDLQLIEKELLKKHISSKMLPVEIASHTSWMRGAVLPFSEFLREIPFQDPLIPVLSGVTGERVLKKKRAFQLLERHLTETLHWSRCMDSCLESKTEVVLELGPGCQLARLMNKRYPKFICRSVDEFKHLDSLANWINKNNEKQDKQTYTI